jgi:hypothetical protein
VSQIVIVPKLMKVQLLLRPVIPVDPHVAPGPLRHPHHRLARPGAPQRIRGGPPPRAHPRGVDEDVVDVGAVLDLEDRCGVVVGFVGDLYEVGAVADPGVPFLPCRS